MTKPTIFFRARYENNVHYILPACPAADALMSLMGRGSINKSELPLVNKMGFNIFVAGDSKELARALRQEGEKHSMDKGVINYGG